MNEEDKQEILNAVFPALKMCRAMTSLEGLEYDEKQDVVFAQFRHGIRVVHVEGDSGYAMLKDILNHILGG